MQGRTAKIWNMEVEQAARPCSVSREWLPGKNPAGLVMLICIRKQTGNGSWTRNMLTERAQPITHQADNHGLPPTKQTTNARFAGPAWIHILAKWWMVASSCMTSVAAPRKYLPFLSFHSSHAARANRDSAPFPFWALHRALQAFHQLSKDRPPMCPVSRLRALSMCHRTSLELGHEAIKWSTVSGS